MQELLLVRYGEIFLKCRKLLWLYYNDELSWKVIADMTGLKNATTAKAAASRCRQTFREKYHS